MKSKLYKVLPVAFLLLVGASCTDEFDKINTNVNAPTVDKAAPDQLLTNAIESMTDRVHEIFLGHEMGSCWVQQMAKAQYTDEDRYIFRPDVINTTWASFYAASGNDIDLIYKIGVAKNNPNYQGVGLIMKVYVVSVLTDLFGDIPYSQAWKGGVEDGGILQAEYDTQESIYADLLAKLDEANTILDPDGTEINGDILFHNDIDAWKKFANSLRLRLLLRMSAKNEAMVTTEMTKIVGDAATYPIFEGNEDAAALVYLGSSPNNNPINENRKTRDDHRVSAHFIDLLLNTYGDYRVMVFAKPSSGTDEFVGMPNGLTSQDAAAFNGNGLANTSKIGDYFSAATAPGMLMSYAELEFILAEAAFKGYIPGGDAEAQAHYEAGITASFDQFRAPLQAIFTAHSNDAYGGLGIGAGYTVDDELDYAINTGAAWNSTDGLQLIAEQRYIATFDQGLQSWFEWRRTGFPVLTAPAASTNGGKVPVRLPYPNSEDTRNQANKNAAIARQGADDLNTKVWWDAN